MYSIERTLWGFKLTFDQTISNEGMQKWLKESQQALVGVKGNFGILVDMRTLRPLTTAAQNTMIDGQQMYKKAGMVRSVLILNGMGLTLQFRRLAIVSGVYQWERYIDGSSITNWEQVGIDWLTKEIDPDMSSGWLKSPLRQDRRLE